MSETMLKSAVPVGKEILAGSCVWKIENFYEKWTILQSTEISLGSENEMKLKLLLSKVKVSGDVWYSMKASVTQVTTPLYEALLRHRFSVLDCTGKELSFWTRQHNTEVLNYTTMHIAMLSEDMLRRKFTIVYGISLHDLKLKAEIPVGTMPRDFQMLFESQKGSDVKFLVDSQEFTAHKVVLSTRSPVLSAMFDTAMKERHENQVKIDDIDAETFKELLRFMYTDQVENLREYAYELFKVAHRYELPVLQRMCEDQLSRNLDAENCTVILSTADTYDCKYLKRCALEYMTDHAANVRKTKGCDMLAKSYPHLLLEAYHALAANSRKA